MASKINNQPVPTYTIILCIFLCIFIGVGTLGMYQFNETNTLGYKIICNVISAGALAGLVNILTSMFLGELKRAELAASIYDRLYLVVNQLFIKAETEGLNRDEFSVVSGISDIMGTLKQYCEVDIDMINNKYERLKQNPPIFQNKNESDLPKYSAVQALNESLVKQNYKPATNDSGSGAPPINPYP